MRPAAPDTGSIRNLPDISLMRFALILCLLAPLGAQNSRPARTLWKGHSGEFTIDWSTGNLQVFRAGDAHPVLDLREAAAADWKQISKDSDYRSLTSSYAYRLLSVVGPVLSIEEEDYCDCGGAHPIAGKMFRAIDLNRSSAAKPVAAKLTDLFSAPAISAALREDRVVKSVLPPGAPPQSLDALLNAVNSKSAAVGECSYFFPDDLLQHFAIYDLKADRAAVRVSLSHAVEICRGSMIQLGLWLPVPDRLWPPLKAAKSGSDGLLMVNHKSGEDDVTRFEFSLARK